ncbi:MAG: hypothetical protein N3F03_08820 [Ignavibacteria bacterium]|nr:hypothetical protein [Ignavibacteria bacterium]
MEFLIISLLIIAGLILIILEVLLMPGLITGIVGGLLLLSSVVYAFVEFGFSGGVIVLAISCALLIVVFFVMKKLKVWNRFVLSEENKFSIEENIQDNLTIGMTGIALTDLKPTGFVLVDDKKFDATSSGEFIPKNSKIEIVSIQGFKVTVKKVEE